MEKAVVVTSGNLLTPSALSCIPLPVLISISLHCKRLSMSVPSRRLRATEGRGLLIRTELYPLKIYTLNPYPHVTIFEIGHLRKELKLNEVIRVGPYPIGHKPILFLVRRGKDIRSLGEINFCYLSHPIQPVVF